MKRRSFLHLAAAMPAMAAAPIDVAAIKSRGNKKVEIVYKSPHTTPNALQATRDGVWVADDHTVDGKNWISLVNYSDGKVIREFQVAGLNNPSGMTVDGQGALWINSTHSGSGLIFNCSADDGKILAKYNCPGSGISYRLKGDPPVARSPLTPAYPPPKNPNARQAAVAVVPDEAQRFRRDRCRSPLRPALSAKAAKAWNTAMACCISQSFRRAASMSWTRRPGKSRRCGRWPVPAHTASVGKAIHSGSPTPTGGRFSGTT